MILVFSFIPTFTNLFTGLAELVRGFPRFLFKVSLQIVGSFTGTLSCGFTGARGILAVTGSEA
jgi:hypothetical protein